MSESPRQLERELDDLGPGEADADLLDGADGDEDEIDCPFCGESIWREAERCPRCRTWLTEADREGARGRGGRVVWVVVVVVLVLVIVLLWR